MNVAKTKSYYQSLDSLQKNERLSVYDAVSCLERGETTALGLHDEPLSGRASDFRSLRADDDIRIIYAKVDSEEAVLCFVGHHQTAYRWAERNRCTRNPRTRVHQAYENMSVDCLEYQNAEPYHVGDIKNSPYPFRYWPTDEDLLDLGVPQEQMLFVRGLADEDALNLAGSRMPMDVWDALIEIFDRPDKLPMILKSARSRAARIPEGASLAKQREVNPDAMCSFVSGDEELNRMRDGDLALWRVFLYPEQRKIVEWQLNGPARISGGAGTGKTVVAIHRVKWLIENRFKLADSARGCTDDGNGKTILLTTFTRNLAADLKDLLSQICSPSDMALVDVQTIDQTMRNILRSAGKKAEVDYTGTGKGISREQAFLTAIDLVRSGQTAIRYASAVVDETQDLDGLALDLLAALTGNSREHSVPNSLFLVGDSRQRIYGIGEPLSYHGIMTVGRSAKLTINYRSTQKIRKRAEAVLHGVQIDDLEDVISETMRGRSLVLGTSPEEVRFYDAKSMMEHISETLKSWMACDDCRAGASRRRRLSDYAILAGTNSEADRIAYELRMKWIPAVVIDGKISEAGLRTDLDAVRVMTLHRAKGLEFEGVVVVLNAGIWPSVPHGGYATEEARVEAAVLARCQLYTAITRAIAHVMITGVGVPDEALSDVLGSLQSNGLEDGREER